MKKLFLFIIILFFLFSGCSGGTENNPYNSVISEETKQEKELNDKQTPKVVNISLSKDNYNDYVNFVLLQKSQTHKFIKSQYRVKYRSNGLIEDIWTSSTLNTNLYSSVKLLNSVYEITTIYDIFITPQSSIYNFSGAIFILEVSSTHSTLQLDNYGYAAGSFTISEQKYNMTGYDYNLSTSDIVKDILGTIYYYE